MLEYYLEFRANKRIFYESKATLKNEHYPMHPFDTVEFPIQKKN